MVRPVVRFPIPIRPVEPRWQRRPGRPPRRDSRSGPARIRRESASPAPSWRTSPASRASARARSTSTSIPRKRSSARWCAPRSWPRWPTPKRRSGPSRLVARSAGHAHQRHVPTPARRRAGAGRPRGAGGAAQLSRARPVLLRGGHPPLAPPGEPGARAGRRSGEFREVAARFARSRAGVAAGPHGAAAVLLPRFRSRGSCRDEAALGGLVDLYLHGVLARPGEPA